MYGLSIASPIPTSVSVQNEGERVFAGAVKAKASRSKILDQFCERIGVEAGLHIKDADAS